LVLLAECPRELALLCLVEVRLLDDPHKVVTEVWIGNLNLRDAVLVVELDSRVIGGGCSEVVDRDIVAKHLTSALLASDQRRAGEAQEAGVWERVSHVEREDVVLCAVRLVGDHDYVVSL